MRRRARAVLLVAALAALPVPAAAQDICAALDRLAAAAREPVPFASVRTALAAGEAVLPGFRAEDCIATRTALSCDVTDMVVDHFDGWPSPLACPGLAPVPSRRRRAHGSSWEHAYAGRGLSIEYGVSCFGCRAGALSYFELVIASGRPLTPSS